MPVGSAVAPESSVLLAAATCPRAPMIPGSVGPLPHTPRRLFHTSLLESHTKRWDVPPADVDTCRPRPSYVLVSDAGPSVNEVRFPAASHAKSWLRVPSR